MNKGRTRLGDCDKSSLHATASLRTLYAINDTKISGDGVVRLDCQKNLAGTVLSRGREGTWALDVPDHLASTISDPSVSF